MRKPFFANSGLSIGQQKQISIPNVFSRHLIGGKLFLFYFIFQKWSIWGSLQNPVGAKTRSNIYKMHQNDCQNIVMYSLLFHFEKGKYIQKRSVERAFGFSMFPVLCFSTFSGSAVKNKTCFVPFFSATPSPSRNTMRVIPPYSSGRQKGSKKKQEAPSNRRFSIWFLRL